ncbi:hypothetical protein C6W10_26420 [Plantactinospora sp. BB1]|nr:hypothetical protein [Plantactinospora sp. BB1]AVT39388.1 hypothetical protein C6W10_26420 [Plantactinospora sp. BB1]
MSGSRSHIPSRPLWYCHSCPGVPWPCPPARASLLAEYADDRTALAVYLGSNLYEALADLHRLRPNPGPDAAAVFARFLAWAVPPRAPYWPEGEPSRNQRP